MNSFIGLDIETRGNIAVAERLWKPPSRLKDPNKIAEAKADYIEKAAISPLTGELVVIGLIGEEGAVSYIEGTEKEIIERFWELVTPADQANTKFVFWSGSGASSVCFDMDFIVTRSRILGIKVPECVRHGRFYGSRFVDLASEFLLYQTGEYLSLSHAGMVFGLFDGKHDCRQKLPEDEVTGANFAFHYDQKEEGRAKALSYLRNDLMILFHLANAIL